MSLVSQPRLVLCIATGSLLLSILLFPIPVSAANTSNVEVVAVAPDPVAPDDVGEYLVLDIPPGIDTNTIAIGDGESRAHLPDTEISGPVIVSPDPEAVLTPRGVPILGLEGRLALANTGEAITIYHQNTAVATVTYDRSREGGEYIKTTGGWQWRTIGATDFPIMAATEIKGTVFVLPDAPGAVIRGLADAEDRILLAGYTYTSQRATDTLCQAHARGVSVRVLVERDPVGGLTPESAAELDRLTACGVLVRVLGGPYARYAFHHAKYAVVDDGVLVLTENWKPAGTGGESSRGWVVHLRGDNIAEPVASLFYSDYDFRAATPWRQSRARTSESLTSSYDETHDGQSFPSEFEPDQVDVNRVELVVAPETAEYAFVELIEAAEESIRIKQVRIGSRHQPLLTAALLAAERGVNVRVLVSSAWYVRGENQALVDWLNSYAERNGLPVEARLAEPGGRFEKIHAKGLIVDEEAVVVGSVNWNNASLRRNRELAVILHGPEPARYFARVFDADWRQDAWSLPVGLGGSVTVAVLVAGVIGGRALDFDF